MSLPTSAQKAAAILQIENQITDALAALALAQNNLNALQAELVEVQAWETFDEPPPPPLLPPSAPEGLSVDPYGLRWQRQQYEGEFIQGYEVQVFAGENNIGILNGTLTVSNDGEFMLFAITSNNYNPAEHSLKVRATPVTLPDGRVSVAGYWSVLGPQTTV